MKWAPVLLAVVVWQAAGCQFPRDVDETLSEVRAGEMRVGIVPNEPWVTLEDGRPGGVEVTLVGEFAEHLGSRVKWVRGAETELIEALEGGQLDLVVGGLTRDSTHAAQVTLTRPYVTTEVVLAHPADDVLPDDLDGVRIGVEAHSAAAAELERQTDAEPVPVESIAAFEGPVAVEDHLVADLGLVATDRSLSESEHVMAVTNGENAFLTELEFFLLDRGDEAVRLLDAEDAP